MYQPTPAGGGIYRLTKERRRSSASSFADAPTKPLGIIWPVSLACTAVVFFTIGLHLPRLYEVAVERNNVKLPSSGGGGVNGTKIVSKYSGVDPVGNETSLLFQSLREFFPKIREVNLEVPFRPMRDVGETILQNWSFVSNEVEEAGHSWCSLYRDNWACVGDRYKEVLQQTPLYNQSFALDAFPSHSNIYVDGNSIIGQLISTIICNSKHVDHVWLLEGSTSNSLFVKSTQPNITLLLVCNSIKLQNSPADTLTFMKTINFTPDYIIRGITNNKVKNDDHHKIFTEEFPFATYLNTTINHRNLPDNCRADFRNCEQGIGHTCLPGPVNTFAEQLVRNILEG